MTGWYASFRVANPSLPKEHRGHYSFRRIPVAHWDNGYGWVSVAEHQKHPGHLMRADEVRFANWEFMGYYPLQHLIGVLPGAGWSARYADMDGSGGHGDSPILAWLIYDDGDVKAFDMSIDGAGSDPCEMANFVQLVPPGDDSADNEPEADAA